VADLALWYMGEPESVFGRVATLDKRIDVDDTGAMLLRFRSGALGVIEASWASRPALSAIEIYGTALKSRSAGAPPARARAYLDEGRLLVLELMGHLVSYYRDRPPEPGRGPVA